MKDPEFDFNYTVKRSSRRSIAIQITADGEVMVRAPYLATNRAVRDLLRSKRSWIEKHLAAAKERASAEAFTEDELKALKKAARKDLIPRVEYFASVMGLRYGQVSVRAQRTRWGSCSRKGNLNFNCILILLPEEVRDYVVVHELAHLREMNHSARFWAEVGKVLPDYKARKAELRKLGDPLISRLR